MVNVAILGSTGSIGSSAIEVIRRLPSEFRVVALSTNADIRTLKKQIQEFRPRYACVSDTCAAAKLKKDTGRVGLFSGAEGLAEMVSSAGIDRVLLAISGSAALPVLIKAIECGRDVALANKEALVMAGPIIMRMARKFNVRLLPIDSEQSAIWQCLNGQGINRLKKIYLTASGGPFRNTAKNRLKDISINQVLQHPRWKMGKKITVDSATLMNKGLELLEAIALFDIGAEKIEVLIHPEAIIHSMTEFTDGVIMAQLSATDMRIPIQYALSYPRRLFNSFASVDFPALKSLNFEKPDFSKFPCLKMAYRAAYEGGTLPAALNAANEVAVDEFLKGRLSFLSIASVIERTMDRHSNRRNPRMEDILESDDWAKREASKIIGKQRMVSA